MGGTRLHKVNSHVNAVFMVPQGLNVTQQANGCCHAGTDLDTEGCILVMPSQPEVMNDSNLPNRAAHKRKRKPAMDPVSKKTKSKSKKEVSCFN